MVLGLKFGMGVDRCAVWQFKEWKDPNGFRKRFGFKVNKSFSAKGEPIPTVPLKISLQNMK